MKRKPPYVSRGLAPDVLKGLATEALEAGMAAHGFVSLREAEVEAADAYPNRVEDLPSWGFLVQMAPDESWEREFRRWHLHFLNTDPQRVPWLGGLYDSATHTLRVFDGANFEGGRRVV